MAPAVRSPRIKSAIITGRARNGGLLASRNSQYSGVAERHWPSQTAAGNGIFGCRDGRLKSAEGTASVTGDRKSGTIPAKIPKETATPTNHSAQHGRNMAVHFPF